MRRHAMRNGRYVHFFKTLTDDFGNSVTISNAAFEASRYFYEQRV